MKDYYFRAELSGWTETGWSAGELTWFTPGQELHPPTSACDRVQGRVQAMTFDLWLIASHVTWNRELIPHKLRFPSSCKIEIRMHKRQWAAIYSVFGVVPVVACCGSSMCLHHFYHIITIISSFSLHQVLVCRYCFATWHHSTSICFFCALVTFNLFHFNLDHF